MLRLVWALTACLLYHAPLAYSWSCKGQAEFVQLPDCPVNFIYQDDKRIHSDSLLHCARLCNQNHTCQGFNHLPSNKGSPNCGIVNVTVASCSDLRFVLKSKFYLRSDDTPPTSACSTAWTLAFVQEVGTAVEGSISYLQEMVERGSALRILIDINDGKGVENALQLFTADAAWVINKTVVAQVYAFQLVYNSTYDTELPVWTRLQVNTSGWVNLAAYNYHNDEFPANIYWFVKKSACFQSSSTVLEMNSSGTVLRGSVGELIYAVEKGFPIQVVEKRGQSDWRSFPALNIVASSRNKTFSIHGNWIDSSTSASDGTTFSSEYVSLENWPTFTRHSYHGVDIMNPKWSPNLIHENFEQISFTVDACWEKVVAVDHFGDVTYGSFSTLVERIRIGVEIRVVYKCSHGDHPIETHSIDRLTVYGSIVTAFSSNDFMLPTLGKFQWMRRHISSNGTVLTISHNTADGSQDVKSCQANSWWFAEKGEREEYWYYHELNSENAEFHSVYPVSHFYKGLMPRLVYAESDEVKIHAYSLQTVRNTSPFADFKTGNTTVFAFNYRDFNGSSLAVTLFLSLHEAAQMCINVDLSPGSPEANGPIDIIPYWMNWYA